MVFSVGVLYSARDFLRLIKDSPITHREFLRQFREFEAAETEGIIDAALTGHWVRLDSRGNLCPTKRGETILAASTPEEALRHQIRYLISAARPPWAEMISQGREKVRYFPPDVQQCFTEAGLLGAPSDEIARWWNILTEAANGSGEEYRNETGRIGERLSIDYERKRTGMIPLWQSLESSFAGYDILSKISKEDSSPLMIEVKTTNEPYEDASFYLSRNEWDVAKLSTNYCVHLWVLKPDPRLIKIAVPNVGLHVPSDAGTGKWKKVQIPFASFS